MKNVEDPVVERIPPLKPNWFHVGRRRTKTMRGDAAIASLLWVGTSWLPIVRALGIWFALAALNAGLSNGRHDHAN